MQVSFRPSPFAAPVTWTLTNGHVYGPAIVVDLRRVTKMTLGVDAGGRGRTLFSLALSASDLPDGPERIVCDAARNSDDARAAVVFMRAVLEAVNLLAPSARVRMGTAQSVGFAAIGAGMLAAAIHGMAKAFGDGHVGFGLGLWGTFVALGAFLVYAAAPWRLLSRLAPHEAARRLATV